MERMPMTFGSLFAGIGGFDLGLERAGMTCKWQVEIDDYASRVLAKHWPDVPRHGDVRTFPTADRDWSVDLICGGFPCQDISVAGRKQGLSGKRSGLWYEYARVIGELRPKYVIVENVAALLTRGMDDVLGTLAALGYDAEWHVIPASAVGAPHRRERVWIVAYPNRERRHEMPLCQPVASSESCIAGYVSHQARGSNVAHADYEGEPNVPLDAVSRRGVPEPARGHQWWVTEPDVGRVAHGVPSRVDRLRGLGNAVVPQVVEVIGRAIIEAEAKVAQCP
jgi:DNA (cytosine-5)-methyltransferase 1